MYLEAILLKYLTVEAKAPEPKKLKDASGVQGRK